MENNCIHTLIGAGLLDSRKRESEISINISVHRSSFLVFSKFPTEKPLEEQEI